MNNDDNVERNGEEPSEDEQEDSYMGGGEDGPEAHSLSAGLAAMFGIAGKSPAEQTFEDDFNARIEANSDMVVYKYRVPVQDVPGTFDLPHGARIMHVGMRGRPDEIHVWAMVPVAIKTVQTMQYRTYGTGHIIKHADIKGMQHHTVIHGVSGLVWHLFFSTKDRNYG